MNARPRVLALVHVYLPGYQSGGPVRSLSGLVDWLGDEIEMDIVTRDRDKDNRPYENVRRGEWQRVGKANVYYARPDELGLAGLSGILATRRFDTLYLNSFFNPVFTFRPLLLRRFGRLRPDRTIVAPRGEFSPGALAIKSFRKSVYLRVLRASGMLRNITWQASGEAEAADIRKHLGSDVPVVVARNLSPREGVGEIAATAPKKSGTLRVVTVARIAPIKNLLFSLESLARLDGDVTFDIYGPVDDTRYWEKCQPAIAGMPPNVRVRYLGPIPHGDVRGRISSYDVFLLPTLSESFGHAILDALIAGTPIVISDGTPWRDLVSHGVGWDIPVERPEEFVSVLRGAMAAGPQEWRAMRERVSAYGEQQARDSVAVEQNRSLFFASGRRDLAERPTALAVDAAR